MARIFDYPDTCPKINKLIAKAESEIDSFLDQLLDEACPLLSGEHRRNVLNGWVKNLYATLEPIFEEVRETNADMRSAAEDQITSIRDEIAELKAEVSA